MTQKIPLQFIRLPEVKKITGLSRSSIYAKINPDSPYFDPSFPKPIKLTAGNKGATAWSLQEILIWMKSRLDDR